LKLLLQPLNQFLSQVQGHIMMTRLEEFYYDDSAQDLIEYVLVGALLALAAMSSMRGLGTKIGSAFNTISNELSSDT
jgi:Flp pilus assembly pilin Flp